VLPGGWLSEALKNAPRSGQPPKVTAALEAKITSLPVAIAVGAARWTLSLLNERLVSARLMARCLTNETICKVLKKKATSSPG
jgi:hypothetical protein